MELIVHGKTFNTDTDIVPGALEFEEITPVTEEDFIKTIEFDKTTIETINKNESGDSSEK